MAEAASDRTDAGLAPSIAFHMLTPHEVAARLGGRLEGLTGSEVEARLVRYGPNRLPEPAGKTLVSVFLSQFRSPFIYLLLAAAAVSAVLGHASDAVFIFVVLVSNAAIGTFQEWQAEERAKALKSLIHVTTSVWRDGRLQRVDGEALVPGDVVQVESGEKIAADIRLLQATSLAVDESLLTGESLSVAKVADGLVAAEAPLGDRVTMLHAGTVVQSGRGLGMVVATGRDTMIGSLAASLEKPDVAPPLVVRMQRFTRQIAFATLALIGIIFLLEWARGAALTEIVLLAIALAVSAIPEGLPVAMTVALSIATQRMGRRNVIVRHMPAVEGLGACTLIATDKTGTLTMNRLAVAKLWLPEAGMVVPEDGRAAPLLVAGALASEIAAVDGDELRGDAVDLAFHAAAEKAAGSASRSREANSRIPYEAEKRFAAAFSDQDGRLDVSAKGAPETILGFCAGDGTPAIEAANELSRGGYRVIAVAAGEVATCDDGALAGLRLLGLAGLIDPLRPEAKAAVADASAAGIRVVMVTGDHPLTALAIARELTLASSEAQVVTGPQLRGLDDAAFDAEVAEARVFARIEPLQKLAIVESFRRQGHVVAVTGDGVNDAAALHAADIGVAMGKAGTDVAREAADLILTDDNFASIVAGIEEGRVAYDNLRKVILLLISTGAAEILLMLLSSLIGLPPPLTAVQLLWLNLVTNGMQDVALAFEKGERDILRYPPRPAHAPIFDRPMVEQVALSGVAIGLIGFVAYAAMLRAGLDIAVAQGVVLWLLVWCGNAHCLNCRSETRSVFRIPLLDNPLLIGAIIGTQLLQLAAASIPAMSNMLSLGGVTWQQALALSLGGLLVLAVMEAYKALRRAPDRAARALGV